MSKPITGGCHCGAIRYTVSTEPMWVGHCQCTNCQTFSGAGHATNLLIPSEALDVTGDLASYSYDADSGNRMTRYFCPTCSTPIYGQGERTAHLSVVRVGSLDEPDALEPQMVIYTDSALHWDTVDGDLPSLPGMPQR